MFSELISIFLMLSHISTKENWFKLSMMISLWLTLIIYFLVISLNMPLMLFFSYKTSLLQRSSINRLSPLHWTKCLNCSSISTTQIKVGKIKLTSSLSFVSNIFIKHSSTAEFDDNSIIDSVLTLLCKYKILNWFAMLYMILFFLSFSKSSYDNKEIASRKVHMGSDFSFSS